jgi:hypothetical protein
MTKFREGVDGLKSRIMGGSLRRKLRSTRNGAEATRIFESMRRYLVKAPAGRMIVHLADV